MIENNDADEVAKLPDPPNEILSVAGDWLAPAGTGGMTIEQQGRNLQVSVLVFVEGQLVPFVGTGTIDGRKLNWNASTVDNLGISYEYACSGRLVSSNNSIQGKCDGYGGQTDVYVNRM